MDTAPPPFFNRGPAPLVRLAFFGVLAIFLMVLDARFRYAEPLRQALVMVAYPLQQAALAPVRTVETMADYFSSKAQLQKENDALRARALQSAKDLMTMEALTGENAQLRRLTDARQRLPRSSTLAEIQYAGRDVFSRKVIVDKGESDGLQAGLAVIDDIGVVGQVTRVHATLAEVTLVTNKDHAIPVQVARNGLRAVAFGTGDGATLDLRYMAANADVQNGDMLVTSGIDGTYPPGLPVARVSRIERDAAYAFAKITCMPAAGTDRHRQVLVLSPDPSQVPPPAATADTPSKTGKPRRARPRKDG
jgi:rod shape-determining protein MreC